MTTPWKYGLVAVALLVATPAYADFVLVTTSVGGEGPSQVITTAANRTAEMFGMMVDAGASPHFFDMLYFDLDLEHGAWVVRSSFVVHVQDPQDSEAVAGNASSYDLTNSFIMVRYLEPVEVVEPAVVVNNMLPQLAGDRLVVTATVTNTADRPVENLRLDLLIVDNLAIRQTVGTDVLLSVNGTTSDGDACHGGPAVLDGNTFELGGTCLGGMVALYGLTLTQDDPVSVPAGGSAVVRVVVAGHEGLDIHNTVSRGSPAGVAFSYDLGGDAHATDSYHARVR